jgi:hypothetical protein
VLVMIREDLLAVAPGWDDRLERYADLQESWDTRTVAVFLEPISAARTDTSPEEQPAPRDRVGG